MPGGSPKISISSETSGQQMAGPLPCRPILHEFGDGKKIGNYHLDKATPIGWDAVSHGLVGLWDLIAFSVHNFLSAMSLIDQEAGCCAIVASKDQGAAFPAEWENRFVGNLGFVIKKCEEIQSDSGADLAQRIIEMARQKMSLTVINNSLFNLKSVIEDAVKNRAFTYIPDDERKKIINAPAHWAGAWSKFSSIRQDSERAIECYAHGLYDACVFQAMVVLECGLASLAKALKVTRGVKAWGTLIEDIEKAIAAFSAAGRSTPKGAKSPTAAAARKRAELVTFYSEAAKEFTYFKDAWRNHVSHGRARYEKQDAEKVLMGWTAPAPGIGVPKVAVAERHE